MNHVRDARATGFFNSLLDLDKFESWEWWWGSWRNVIRCGSCGALMNWLAPCPVCGLDYSKIEPEPFSIDGGVKIAHHVFQGPLDWSFYVMLQMMHADWQRPLRVGSLPASNRSSPCALVVLIF